MPDELLFLSFNLNASLSLPKKLGSPIRVSPIPGPANPDPILNNLQTVMDNHYVPPYYPGVFNSPDYLSALYYFSNSYIGNGLIFNPLNDKVMHMRIGQNMILDFAGIFSYVTIGSNTFATSFDGGLSWCYGPPTEQIIPLGGTISQIINASLGPGLFVEYTKEGRLLASGHGFMNMVANPPDPFGSPPKTGFLFTYSDDEGKHWSAPNIVLTSDVNWWFVGGPYLPFGLGPREFYTKVDPANSQHIHASTMFPLFPEQKYGNIFYFLSKNGGKTFSKPKQVYSMVDDPVWLEKHFDPDFTSDPNYFQFGGWSLSSTKPVVVDQNVVLLPTLRIYPKVGATTYTGIYGDTTVYDQAFVRSLDNGKTWCKVAGAAEQYLYPNNIFDPGFIDPNIPVIIDGQEAFGFIGDFGAQANRVLVSQTTGRIYSTFSAINPLSASVSFPGTGSDYLLVSASSDQGATWSSSVQINATPTNISLRAQQVIAPNAILVNGGWYVAAYYDFRNWTGTPGEDLLTTPLPTDCWLAIYRETSDPKGGSTGIGLDFVEEIRITPQSFNARIVNIETAFPYVSPYITGTPQGIPLTVNNNNELYVVFSMQSEGSPSNLETNAYKGMTIDKNGYMNLFIQRLKFPKPSNQ